MSFNIPRNGKKRIVVVGGGFGGLNLCRALKDSGYQVVLVDKNNFHQFPPLIYQVATSGLQPNAITFPFRKLFEDRKDFYFRLAELRSVHPEENYIQTSIGKLDYDYLVLAMGATTNFFGSEHLAENAIAMKTIDEAMGLRNALLSNFERSVTCASPEERQELLNVVIVGGGPTGVEIAGAIAEMRRYILPTDYPDLDVNNMHIHLIQGDDRLLPAMSEKASRKAYDFLKELGVEIETGKFIVDYVDHKAVFSDGRTLPTRSFIWVCGVRGQSVTGLERERFGHGGRLKVDAYNRVIGERNIYAIGDLCLMQGTDPEYRHGHPQMAQPAIQQGLNLAENFRALLKGGNVRKFTYRDLGSMATIGRNKAVADVMGSHFTGFFAWLMWMGVHLISILGVRNKVEVFLDWAWSYCTYDKSNRMILMAKKPRVLLEREEREKVSHWGVQSPPVIPAENPGAQAVSAHARKIRENPPS